MPKIEDSLPQPRVLQNLPEARGGNSANDAARANQPDANKHQDRANLNDAAAPREAAHERKQELQSRLPLANQMLRHNLQSFDKAQSKHLPQPRSAPDNRERDARGMPKQNGHPHKQSAAVEVSVKSKHFSADAKVAAKNDSIEASARAKHASGEVVAAPKNALQSVERALTEHAEKVGLPVQEQKDFVEKFTNKFVAEAKSKNAEKLLEKTDDFSLLSNSRFVVGVKVGNRVAVNLSAEAAADLKARQIKLGINLDANANGAAHLDANSSANVKPKNSANSQNPIFGNPRPNPQNPAATHLRINLPHQFPNNSAPRANLIDARINNFPNLQMPSRREVGEFKNDLIARVADVLQRVGVDADEIRVLSGGGGDANAAQNSTAALEDLRGAAQFFGSAVCAAEDNALFASALGIAAEAAGESRVLNGDGLLLEFANYGAAKNDALSLDALVQNLLQNGSKVGLENLLAAVKLDLNEAALDNLAQVADKLPTGGKKDFVVGVLTMSVMTRETLERLDTIASGASLGLSDDAMAALQKASNNLRDHLTAQDLIGATGEVKGAPVTINGETYNFLSEVTEAINSLRDARNRVTAEIAGASGVAASSRFAVEADALLNIVRNVETMLRI